MSKIIITGGAGRLGKEIALRFAGDGAEIAIIYNRSKSDAADTLKEIDSLGGRGIALKADAEDVGQIESAVKKAAKELGGIDILVNNAAVFSKMPIDKVSMAEWNELLNINLRAPFFFAKAAEKFLRKGTPGRMINISDTYAFSPAAHFVPYGISKAGVVAMTKGLAKELAPNVLVNCVCPGVIGFGLELAGGDKRAVTRTLLKKAVDVKDVVDAVLFLAKNNSMTGQVICIDGGKNV